MGRRGNDEIRNPKLEIRNKSKIQVKEISKTHQPLTISRFTLKSTDGDPQLPQKCTKDAKRSHYSFNPLLESYPVLNILLI
jgi:hypothetical protein